MIKNFGLLRSVLVSWDSTFQTFQVPRHWKMSSGSLQPEQNEQRGVTPT